MLFPINLRNQKTKKYSWNYHTIRRIGGTKDTPHYGVSLPLEIGKEFLNNKMKIIISGNTITLYKSGCETKWKKK